MCCGKSINKKLFKLIDNSNKKEYNVNTKRKRKTKKTENKAAAINRNM